MNALNKNAQYDSIESAAKALGVSSLKSKTPAGKIEDIILILENPAKILGLNSLLAGIFYTLTKKGIPVLSITETITNSIVTYLKANGSISESELDNIITSITGKASKFSFYQANFLKLSSSSITEEAFDLITSKEQLAFLGALLKAVFKWILEGAGLLK